MAGLEIIDGWNQGVWGTGPGAELSVLAEWIDLHLNGLKLCLHCQSFHCFTPPLPRKLATVYYCEFNIILMKLTNVIRSRSPHVQCVRCCIPEHSTLQNADDVFPFPSSDK